MEADQSRQDEETPPAGQQRKSRFKLEKNKVKGHLSNEKRAGLVVWGV